MTNNLIPTNCPSCGGQLEREGVHLVCKSSYCPERLTKQILHWIQACKMEGLSESFVKKLVESKRISSIKDLYHLTAKDFVGIEGFAQKKIENALTQIEVSKDMSLRQFVVRLGINGVGERALEKLGVNSVKQLLSYTADKSVVGQTLEEYVKSMKDFILDLLSVVTVFTEVEKKVGSLTVCMTGKGPKPRKELIAEIEKMGYTFIDHVNKGTNILICEDPNSSSPKLSKAANLGIKIVGYQDFFREKK